MSQSHPFEITPTTCFSIAFWVVSVISGIFTIIVLLALGMVVIYDAPAEQAAVRASAVFCLLAYLYLQVSVTSHMRRAIHTTRARVYFWLLALLPIWSIPVFWLIFEAIFHASKWA